MSDPTPEFPKPRLITCDGDLWVLDKPSGFAVHAVAGATAPDLMAWARGSLGAPAGLAPIHRLDLDASGLVLCAADSSLRGELGRWFADGEVHKEYMALAWGRVHKKGTIRRQLKDPRRRRFLPAVTRYQCLEWLGGFSLLALTPETGRRHQLRRHLHGIGHALVGDRRYRPRRFRAVPGFPGRLWLHAVRLALPDGRSYEAPLPAELERHLVVLREGQMASGNSSPSP